MKNAEIEEAKQKRIEVEKKKLAAERKKYTLTMIEKDAKKDFEMERDEKTLLEACDSDDGDPDVEFEGKNDKRGLVFSNLLSSLEIPRAAASEARPRSS